MSMQDVNNNAVHVVNTSSIVATLAGILGWIPPFLAAIASLFTITWMALQIYESKTFNRILQHRFAQHIMGVFKQ